MKSLQEMRLPGILAVGLVALAVGAAGAPSSAQTGDAQISGLTAAQKKAKAKAIKKCKKIKKASKRKTCIKKVNKKYDKLANGGGTIPKGETKTVGVVDDEFEPDDLTIKAGDEIDWVWSDQNANAHNVTLVSGPSSLTDVDKYNLSTPNSPSVQYTFKRQLTKTGDYEFICTLHSTVMDMKVKVTD